MSEAKERWKIREIILVYFEKQSRVKQTGIRVVPVILLGTGYLYQKNDWRRKVYGKGGRKDEY